MSATLMSMGRQQITTKKAPSKVAVAFEAKRVVTAVYKQLGFRLPFRLAKSLLKDPRIDGLFDEARLLEILGDTCLKLFNDLGPIYGKGAQMALSRLSPDMQRVAD